MLGYAFFVDSMGHAITSYQSLDSCQRILDERGREYRIVDVEEQNDLALIHTDVGSRIDPLRFSTRNAIFSGEAVAYPTTLIGGLPSVEFGFITKAMNSEGQNINVMQYLSETPSVRSGGPVVDEWGDVIGMATRQTTQSSAINSRP